MPNQSRPEPIHEEDPETLDAIALGIAQLDAGSGIPVEDVRREFFRVAVREAIEQADRGTHRRQ
jgi:hypothetical protein